MCLIEKPTDKIRSIEIWYISSLGRIGELQDKVFRKISRERVET